MTNLVSRVADGALEVTIVGSFTKIGPAARSRLYGWADIDVDLTGQRALVTGASSGIGRAVARGLTDLGADVVVTSRRLDRAEAVAAELNATDAPGTAVGMALDTGDLDAVRDVAAELRDAGPLDMVLHNAGAMIGELGTNDRGMELTLASHLVGPYLLTTELRSHLTPGARVIWMSSGGMYTEPLAVDRLELRDPEKYKGSVAYARAKRAQVELVAHLGPQWAPDIIMQAMHPGWVDTPGVVEALPRFHQILGPLLRDADAGADTMVWLAATGGEGAAPGQFWLDRRPRRANYVPGTGADEAEREKLVAWLDEVTAS